MPSCGVRRPSVRLFVCLYTFWANRFYQFSGWVAIKLAHHGPQTGLLSRCAKGQFESPPNLHMMVPRRARIQVMLKVKVEIKGHVIRALL